MKKGTKPFSKEDVKFVILNWEKLSIRELAESLARPVALIYSLSNKIRKAGYALSKQNKDNRIILTVQEALKELDLTQ